MLLELIPNDRRLQRNKIPISIVIDKIMLALLLSKQGQQYSWPFPGK